jgi:hypothetical protein
MPVISITILQPWTAENPGAAAPHRAGAERMCLQIIRLLPPAALELLGDAG